MNTRLIRDVMTKDVVSVRTYTPFRLVASAMLGHDVRTGPPDDTVFRAAYLMRRHDVSHLPVVDRRGVVVGIVARGDLLGEFMREDKVIRDDVLSEVLAHRIEDPGVAEVGVERGVVTLAGEVRLASDALYAVERTRKLPGVVDLRWHTDDRKPQVEPLF